MRVLLFGAGWLGHIFKDYFHCELTSTDIIDMKAVSEVLEKIKPDVVINTAGKTGRPNIDWCEEHKEETVASNITGPLILLHECIKRKILLVHLSSGCIFTGKPPQSAGFNEEDEPNPVSFYSWTKATADSILKYFPTLILRIRMPIDGKPHQRNLITKLANYQKIINVENSITVISDLLFATKQLINKNKTGIFNVVNPGPVKHEDILKLYKEIVDPTHTYELLSEEEFIKQKLVKTGRSNCILDTSKLEKEGIILENSIKAIQKCLTQYTKEYAVNKSISS